MLISNLCLVFNDNKNFNFYTFFSIVFFIGICGIVFKRSHFLITLFAIEIMYVGIICFSVCLSINSVFENGQTYALIFLIIAACESAIGLGILIVLFNFGKSFSFVQYEFLNG